MPEKSSLTKKFLLRGTSEIKLPEDIKKEVFTMEEVFIKTALGDSSVIRKVGKNDSFTYSHEIRYEVKGGKIMKKRQVTAREYI